MQSAIPHEWLYPASLEAAADIQRDLSHKIILQDDFDTINLVGGMDVSNNRFDPQHMIHAAAVIINQREQQVIEKASASIQQKFPYIPGFLGFREVPVLIAAFQKLSLKPDIILVDGHGISHPRRFGIACHVGVLLDCPTIGVAKTILVGKPASALDDSPHAQVPLIWRQQQIAILLRSKARALPLIISPGHKISFESAITIVKQCLTKYRLPEPTRQAHEAANHCRREYDKQSDKNLY